MASWNNPTTHITGDTLAVSDWNVVANNETFLYQAPYAAYYNSVATSLANNANTQLTLGGTAFSGYGFSVSSNNAVFPLTGLYWTAFNVATASTNAGTFAARIYYNGSLYADGTFAATSAVGAASAGGGLLKATAADVLALAAFQNTGGAINSSVGPSDSFLHSAFVGST